MSEENPKAVPIFEVKKKHSWKTSLVHYLEIFLVAGVILGTLVWVIISFHFSFKNLFGSAINFLKPQVASESATGKASSEAEISRLINDRNLFKIAQAQKTSQGDLQVTGTDGLVVFFSTSKDFSPQVATLQTLLSKAKIDNKPIKKVDFRFDKIIIEN